MPQVMLTLMAKVKCSVRLYNLTAERSAHPLNAPWISPTKDLNPGNRELEHHDMISCDVVSIGMHVEA